MSGLFATLNVGKRGLYAQQGALDVTSHNIANSNTKGYTRQRSIMETTRPFGMPSMDNQVGPGQVGTGVEISKIQRVRDTFMDYQVRRETSTLGQYEARDKYLSEIEGIFNEPSDTGISSLIGKFFDACQEVAKHPEGSNSRTVLANQASVLAGELNNTYNKLQKVKENAQESIKQATFDVNNALDKVEKLSQQIMSVKISGMEPNDLMDKRDLLLDELSNKFNIVVQQDKFGSINLKPKYTKTVDGKDQIGNPFLIKKNINDEVRRFSYITGIDKEFEKDKLGNITSNIKVKGTAGKFEAIFKINYYKNGNKDQLGEFQLKITSNNKDENEARREIEEKLKKIDESRVIWSTNNKNDDSKNGLAIDKNGGVIGKNPVKFEDLALFDLNGDEYRGEMKGYMTVQQEVDDYVEQINKLAKSIAFSVNSVHSGVSGDLAVDKMDKDYVPFFVNGDIADKEYKIVDGKKVLYDSKTDFTVGSTTNKVCVLDKVLSAEKEITAANISFNKQIMDDVMQMKTRVHDDQYDLASNNKLDGEKDGSRILAIAQLRDKLLRVQDITKNISRKDFLEANGGLSHDIVLGLSTIKGDINGMKVDSYFKDTIDKLGIQEQEAQRIVKNQGALLKEFSQRRESISGVSLNEEMANIVQYQHAYQANAKIIATTDQLLDVVINGLKK